VKTAQAILGHSDIETTLNTYMHAYRPRNGVRSSEWRGFCSQMCLSWPLMDKIKKLQVEVK